jgi:peptidoglycan/xylan/chitin deacetylase (PgdA/CDA1 family)
VPAHVFTITKWIGGNNRWPGQPTGAPSFRLMDWSQLEAIQEAGFLIEAHTASHPDLRILHDAAIEDEMGEADTIIESRLGRRPRYFAYPYGHHDARVRALASKRYRGCFTTKLDYMGPDTAFDAIPRLDAHYLRSMKLVRSLAGKPAQAYIGLRRALRRLKGH